MASLRRSVPGVREETRDSLGMSYMISRRTGVSMPGHFWNPPANCKKKVMEINRERWVDAGTCGECPERKHGCEAKDVNTKKTWEELKSEVYKPKRRS